MIYRLFAAAIVVFWLAMTALLLRREFSPADSALREVPVAHVIRMMLQREQPSDLQLYYDKTIVGHVRIHPRMHDGGQRRVSAHGWLQVGLPGAGRQRFAWTGDLDLDQSLQPQRLKANVNLREPAGTMVDLTADFATRQLRYEAQLGPHILRRQQYSLDEAGAHQWLREQGLDPALIASLQSATAGEFQVRARQSAIEVRGEKIETYLISAEQSEQTLFELQISQLGQIVRLRTMLGYTAAPEEMTP